MNLKTVLTKPLFPIPKIIRLNSLIISIGPNILT